MTWVEVVNNIYHNNLQSLAQTRHNLTFWDKGYVKWSCITFNFSKTKITFNTSESIFKRWSSTIHKSNHKLIFFLSFFRLCKSSNILQPQSPMFPTSYISSLLQNSQISLLQSKFYIKHKKIKIHCTKEIPNLCLKSSLDAQWVPLNPQTSISNQNKGYKPTLIWYMIKASYWICYLVTEN